MGGWVLCVVFVGAMVCASAQPFTRFPDESLEGDFKNWLAFIHATSDQYPSSYSFSSSVRSSKTLMQSEVSSVEHDGSSSDELGTLNEELAEAERNTTLIVVAKDDSGNFTTISAALEMVPMKNKHRVIIHVKSGVYREKIQIPQGKRFITLVGDGEHQTIITWNATAGDIVHNPGNDSLLRTYHSATVGVNSDYFIAKNIRFENSSPVPNPGESGKQAVAFRISGDFAAIYNCSFYGTQDTLYDHKGRHYFKDCFIQGTVDFIFGYGRSLYKDSQIHSIATTFGAIAAQKGNQSHMDTGFSFVDCSITGSGHVYLGRAWGGLSRVIYSFTYMDNIILPQGWSNWDDPTRNDTVFFAQYKCEGPGADTDRRVAWARELTAEEVEPFLSISFIIGNNWLQQL